MSHNTDPLNCPFVQANAGKIREFMGDAPAKLAVTLGSGVGPLADALKQKKTLPYEELEHFPRPTVSGHGGELVHGLLGNVPVLLLKGREHYYENGNVKGMKTPIRSLKAAGINTLLLTNAAGSLQQQAAPGSVMLITDHIFFSAMNPLTGEQGDNRFVDMSEAYDAEYRNRLRAIAQKEGVALAEGVYMWFPGPNFETPAEIRAARILGADAVGMSTAPETIIARHAGLRVACLSVLTNYGAGMEKVELSHDQTKAVAAKAAADMQKLVTAFAATV